MRSGGEGLYGRPRPVPRAHLWRNALTPPPPAPSRSAGECEHYAMMPVHRATARDRPSSRRPGKPTHPCIVGAGLAPALLRCTRSFIRQQTLKALPTFISKHRAFSPATHSRLLPAHSLPWDRSRRSGYSQIPVCRRRRVRAHNHCF